MTGRVFVLIGAPEFHRLDWISTDLLSTFQPAVARFLAWGQPFPLDAASPDAPSDTHLSLLHGAVWRSLALHSGHIHTGFSQQHHLDFVAAYPSSADFLTPTSFSAQSPRSSYEDDMSQNPAAAAGTLLLDKFYAHSLAKHNDTLTSQLVPAPQSQQQHSTLDPGNSNQDNSAAPSFASTNSGSRAVDATTPANASSLPKTPLVPPVWANCVGHLSNLCDIPSAAYLTSIMPSTMTVSLIVGIISIATPRTVETRYGTTKTLVEVLVGDETKSGFSITFWLAEADVQSAVGGVLAGLRNQDVVLIQNVALNVFSKRVYGSSLRRNMTKLHLLYRARTGSEGHLAGYYSHTDLARAAETQSGQIYPELNKTRLARDWVLRFVARDPGVDAAAYKISKGDNARAGPREWNRPPPLESQ